jgi:hypothetical protein
MDKSVERSATRPIDRPADQLTSHAIGRVLDRPKAFYITEEIDLQLEKAVRYYQERHRLRKVDRSILVNTLLSDPAIWSEDELDRLLDRVVDHLKNRLINQL